jgi:hypothetical protein
MPIWRINCCDLQGASELGHRLAWGLLQLEGKRINRKRVRRVWRSLGLHRRRRKSRKIRTGGARVMTLL